MNDNETIFEITIFIKAKYFEIIKFFENFVTIDWINLFNNIINIIMNNNQIIETIKNKKNIENLIEKNHCS